jgi:PKHD-type hydroxylase
MITNSTKVTSYVTHPYVYWDNFFSDIELDSMEKYFSEVNELETGKVYNANGGQTDSEVRKSQIKFIEKQTDNVWIFDKINIITEHINNNFYNYDLIGYDFMQYTEYNKKGDFYGFHTDMIFGDKVELGMVVPRKLSFSLILSDTSTFKGGDFEIDTGGPIQIAEQKRGRILAFPSFVKHQVTPIKKGVRKSLVWWALGPKFK